MDTMYAGKVNSPATTLNGAINDSVQTIDVIDGSVLPDSPNLAVIGTGEDAETILYGVKIANQLTFVTRGFQGIAKAWDSGTLIARMFTEKDYASLKSNITELAGRKLSAFAATTSAELAGVISDEIGAGKLRFDTAVTAKTTTATLNVNEAGTILVSAAGGAYTITLPTAVGNTGLTYHFVKTDANYTLITLDGDGTETLNYENSTSAPVLTYARLNTYCAEVTIVSDNANWQVINERLGQVPEARAYLGTDQLNIITVKETKIMLDTENWDIGNNFDLSTWISGNATSTSANHLVDTANKFTAGMVGYRVKNTTDTTYAYITVYNSASDVTVSPDIFVNTEGYEIKNSKFVAPIPGKYYVEMALSNGYVVANKRWDIRIYKNGALEQLFIEHSAVVERLCLFTNGTFSLVANDYIEEWCYHAEGVSTGDITAGTAFTYMLVRLISKT